MVARTREYLIISLRVSFIISLRDGHHGILAPLADNKALIPHQKAVTTPPASDQARHSPVVGGSRSNPSPVNAESLVGLRRSGIMSSFVLSTVTAFIPT